MSSFSRWLIAFYAMLSLFRVWIISWFEPSWSHFFERWAKGDASQVIRPHAWGLILTAIALAAIVVAILVIARTVQRRDARGWMSVSLALGGAWIVAFVWRGMPPAYNPLLWLMGLEYRIATVVITLNLFGLEFLLRILAKDRACATAAAADD